MKSIVAFALLLTISRTADGIRCYVCVNCATVSNDQLKNCFYGLNRCMTTTALGVVSRTCVPGFTPLGCIESAGTCVCDSDACNGMVSFSVPNTVVSFSVPTTLTTTTAGVDRHCATALSTIIAVAVTGFSANLF